jgi:hypothetical protein
MSLFPPPDKDGQIKFILAKSLPYKTRMSLVATLLLAGLGLQLTVSFWAGLAVLLAASLLGTVRGYDAKPKVVTGETWERVTPDEYAKIKLKADQLKQWDEDLFDITNTAGVLTFAAACAVCVGGYLILASGFGFPFGYWIYVAFDAVVVLAPLWFTGVREYLRKDKLIIKLNLLESVMKLLTAPSDVQVSPMLALAKTEEGKTEPEDARLLVKLVGAPTAFYGMQVQVSINSVQGKDYPYLYCVLIGKEGAGLLSGYERFIEKPKESLGSSLTQFFLRGLGLSGQRLVYEGQKNKDVDILVIRQYAQGNIGYTTSTENAASLVTAALGMAKKLLEANAPKAPAAPSR